ncbi:MAG: hypothetical protein AB7G28_14715 [Pirellulales bacterium]
MVQVYGLGVEAAVFERDWKAPGDGLLTYDDVNQREWLDLSVSALSQFSAPRLDNALAELAPGGIFDGFTWAQSGDVRILAASGGIDLSSSELALNQSPTTRLIDLISPTLEGNGVLRSVGLINEPQTSHPSVPPFDGAAFLVNFNPTSGGGYAGLFFSLSDDLLRPASNGLMLFRNIPEPSSFGLLIVEICVVILSARQRSR